MSEGVYTFHNSAETVPTRTGSLHVLQESRTLSHLINQIGKLDRLRNKVTAKGSPRSRRLGSRRRVGQESGQRCLGERDSLGAHSGMVRSPTGATPMTRQLDTG